jgi:hypothetical protein
MKNLLPSLLILPLALAFFLTAPAAHAAKTNFTIRQDGIILKEGVPFWPFGFAHVSDVRNRYGTKLAEDVEKMGQAGFNLVQLSVTGPNSEKDSELARAKAAQYGMYIIGSYYKPSYQIWINALKNDPTIMGWNTLDDFNAPYNNPRVSPTQAKLEADTIRNAAKAAGASSLIFGSGGGYPHKTAGTFPKYLFGEYKDSMDLFGTQTYPISNTDDSFANAPMEENIAYLKYSKEQLPENRPLFANLQSFAWEDGRYPNAVETRNMTWAAVVTRMEGIMAYAYWEESGDLSTKTDTWNEWKKLRQDINGDLVVALMDGKYTYIDTTPSVFGKPRIHAATFEHKGKVFVIAMNTNSQTSLTATNQLKLPKNIVVSSKKALFPGDARYEANMNVVMDGDQPYLNGTIASSGIQAYVFDTTGGNTTTPSPSPTPTPTATPAGGGGATGPTDSVACRSDFNGDKKIDREDYRILKQNFFKRNLSNAKTDIDKNGRVNLKDYAIFVRDFQKPCK